MNKATISNYVVNSNYYMAIVKSWIVSVLHRSAELRMCCLLDFLTNKK